MFNQIEIFDEQSVEAFAKLLSAKCHALRLGRANKTFRQLRGALEVNVMAEWTNEADTLLEGHEFVLEEARRVVGILNAISTTGHEATTMVAGMIGSAISGVDLGGMIDDLLRPTMNLAKEFLCCLKPGLPERILGCEFEPAA